MIDWKNKIIERNFTYHKPNDEQIEKMAKIRNLSKELAFMIVDYVPDGLEQEMAMVWLEQVSMWANAGIARGDINV